MNPHYARAEHQRAVDHAVIAHLEGIQAAHVLGHEPWRFRLREIELIERVPVEHQREKEPRPVW
ncbi:hypothetical protein D3C83_86980 [compost metagenome]